jgi:hypothetical protein
VAGIDLPAQHRLKQSVAIPRRVRAGWIGQPESLVTTKGDSIRNAIFQLSRSMNGRSYRSVDVQLRTPPVDCVLLRK